MTSPHKPLIIARVDLNERRDVLTVQFTEHDGEHFVEIVKSWSNRGTPKHVGLTFRIDKLPLLNAGVFKALQTARQRGLLP